jgi:uncharacterized protein (TIGR02217 family)
MSVPIFTWIPQYSHARTPTFDTIVTEFENSTTQRRARRDIGQYVFDLNFPTLTQTEMEEILAFYEARQGRAEAFYYKDHLNFAITAEAVGTGDNNETVFALDKQYIVASSDTVKLDGTPQTRGVDYTIDNDTGIITFATPPGTGVVITTDYEYYWKMYFMSDRLPTPQRIGNVFSMSFNLIEAL